MRSLLRQLGPAVIVFVAFTILLGVAYPLAVTGIGQLAFRYRANGSIIRVDGRAVGSELVGQGFAAPGYFHPRPSSAGAGYDALASGGSNLGPNNPDLLQAVQERAAAFRRENGLAGDVAVPVDAVTASGSGLDPEISVANARLQAPRIAGARHVPLSAVMAVIAGHTVDRPLGVLGDPGVNVLMANLALDRSS